MPSIPSENSSLLGLELLGLARDDVRIPSSTKKRNRMICAFSLSIVVAVYFLKARDSRTLHEGSAMEQSLLSSPSVVDDSAGPSASTKSPYAKVQTLSFQIYTGGAPAFTVDDDTGEEMQNEECKGLHSYGKPETSEQYQCYLGLEDATEDVRSRLNIMTDAVNRAYDVSNKDDDTLKIFLAPEFYFRGKNGAFQFQSKEMDEQIGGCHTVCHILSHLENLVADRRFENWLFLFGSVIASEVLPKGDEFDYQFYNFAPLLRGFDPAASPERVGKNFIVPKRYVSNIDFLTPLRHLTNRSMAMELLDGVHHSETTVRNPHAYGQKQYNNDMWARYKDELASLGYSMIEYSFFFMDGIAFSIEICLDHLAHRALRTYMADIVSGSKARVPSSENDSVEWVGIPKHQAQISLVSSADMDVTEASLVLADGGHIFLQDGVNGGILPSSTFGENVCQKNEYEYFGGSQSVKRTAVVSPTDVTFKYEMNLNYKEYELYSEKSGSRRNWKDVVKGVFSSTMYEPKLTVYDPVKISPKA